VKSDLPPNTPPDARELALIAAKAQQTEKTLEAIYFHFNKHKMSTMDAMIVLSMAFQTLIRQQDNDEQREEMSKLFHKMTDYKKPNLLKRLFKANGTR